ncbi:MAG TPA: hypothetical protein VF185_03315 [Patescibacteria group bacterium]
MAEETKAGEVKPVKKGLPKIAKIALGCLAIFIILAVILSIAGVFLARKLGSAILQKSIQDKTGVQTNLNDIQNGKVSFTDPKTGAKLDIGGGSVPSDFPKDFPIYPGAKVTSSLSGNQTGTGNGFWVTLSTTDEVSKVQSYYETNLKTNGWNIESTIGSGSGVNWSLSKDKLNGYLTIDKSPTAGETSILIVLGESGTVTPPAQ